MMTCPICEAVMMPSSMEMHERFHRQVAKSKEKSKVKSKEKSKENKGNETTVVQSGRVRRKAAEK